MDVICPARPNPTRNPLTASPTAGIAIIEFRNIRHEIQGRIILDLSAWTVRSGAHCLILGPSGSGKTTLLHLMAGLLRPTTGQIIIAGQDLGELAPSEVDAFRGRHIGIVFQTLHLIAALNVADNLRLAQTLAGLPRDDQRVWQVLASLGISDKALVRPSRLSQGEAQRVAIARAVINAPKLILADEPTSALDDRSCGQVLELLKHQARASDSTLVIATHDQRIKPYFDRRLELEACP